MIRYLFVSVVVTVMVVCVQLSLGLPYIVEIEDIWVIDKFHDDNLTLDTQ
jgi:hypothetical protein